MLIIDVINFKLRLINFGYFFETSGSIFDYAFYFRMDIFRCYRTPERGHSNKSCTKMTTCLSYPQKNNISITLLSPDMLSSLQFVLQSCIKHISILMTPETKRGDLKLSTKTHGFFEPQNNDFDF